MKIWIDGEGVAWFRPCEHCRRHPLPSARTVVIGLTLLVIYILANHA